MKWNDLSMTDRASYIKLGLDNGITNLKVIRDIYNKYDEGGPKEDKVLSTGNPIADTALGFVPFVGSAMEIEDAIREPSLRNIGSAAFSVGTDLLEVSLLRGGVKAYKLVRAAKKASKEFDVINSSREVSKANRVLQTPNLNPKKYDNALKIKRESGQTEAFKKWQKAIDEVDRYNIYQRPFIDKQYGIAGFVGGFTQDAIQSMNALVDNSK